MQKEEGSEQQQKQNKESSVSQSSGLFGFKLPVNFAPLEKLQQYMKRDDSTQERVDLFFTNAPQRKDESLKLLNEWAQNRADSFDFSREVIEELINAVDLRSRLSVDFLQVVYKFFSEKQIQETNYSRFLLTKPEPSMKGNYMGTTLFQNVLLAVNSFEQQNLKQCEKSALLANIIETQILRSPIFSEFAELDKKSDTLLSSIIFIKKNLQQLSQSSYSKLNRIIPLFSKDQIQEKVLEKQKRVRKPIFDTINQQRIQTAVMNGISNLGHLFFNPGTLQIKDPAEAELDKQIEEQKAQEQAQKGEISEKQLNLESNDQSNQEILTNAKIVEEQHQNIESDDTGANLSVEQHEQVKNTVEIVQQEQLLQQEMQQHQQQYQGQELTQTNLSKNELKKQQAKGDPQTVKRSQTQQLPADQQQMSDLYHLIQSFIQTEEKQIKQLNLLIEKGVAYWKHVLEVEKKRCEWVKNSCELYSKSYQEVYQLSIDLSINCLPNQLSVLEAYSLVQLFPKDILDQIQQKNPHLDQIEQTLIVQPLACQAPRLLVVKEFKVHRILPNGKELLACLVISIDKFVGCWDILDETNIDNIDKPHFHYQLSGITLTAVSADILEIMPSNKVLFVNIPNDRLKSKLKFQCSDDMEEFSTIIQSQKKK